jgi:hypothetical protein
VDNIRYGFPCELKENKVIIKVPALDTVIKDLKPGKYKSTLDITSSGKYFLQPFNEDIEIIEVPDVSIDKDSLHEEDKLSIVVSELIEDGTEVKKVPISEKIVDKPKDFKSNKKSDKTDESKKKCAKKKSGKKVMEKLVKDDKSKKIASLLDDLF